MSNKQDALSLILASASPRRQEVVPLLGWPWQLLVTAVAEESVPLTLTPAHYVRAVATLKAEAAVAQLALTSPPTTAAVIIAADTSVALGATLLNKPVDIEEARQMLARLRGRVHQVYTAVVLIHWPTGERVVELSCTNVPFRLFTDDEMEAYLATGDSLDKAGGYALQHKEFQPAPELRGCYAGVVGFPLCHVTRGLRRLGVAMSDAIPVRCQAHYGYECAVYHDILANKGV